MGASRTFRDRRHFLLQTLAGAGVAIVPSVARAQTKLTPDAALQELMAGNQRFVAGRTTSATRDLKTLKSQTAEKQEPLAAVLACSDSRLPVELIFDQTIGEIFVTRLAGNVTTPEVIASLEYAVAALGVKAVMVLGHTACGAVKAAMKSSTEPGQISALYQHLMPAVEKSGGDVAKAVEANAKIHADLLRTSSTVIRDALRANKVKVASGVYDLATGKVTLI